MKDILKDKKIEEIKIPDVLKGKKYNCYESSNKITEEIKRKEFLELVNKIIISLKN